MKRISIVFLVVLLGIVGIASAGDEHLPPPSDDPRFEFLKSLEGTWSGPPMGEGHPGSVFEFRVTSGGHAVEEREFVGTPMEMVTLYHMRGKDLMATHYCSLGNQPQAKAAPSVVDQGLRFDCAGTPGNAASHDEEHIHGWAVRLLEDGSLNYTAKLVKNGEVTEAPDMVLTRTEKTASR